MPSEAGRDGSATMGGRLDEGVAGPELLVLHRQVQPLHVVDLPGTSPDGSLRYVQGLSSSLHLRTENCRALSLATIFWCARGRCHCFRGLIWGRISARRRCARAGSLGSGLDG